MRAIDPPHLVWVWEHRRSWQWLEAPLTGGEHIRTGIGKTYCGRGRADWWLRREPPGVMENICRNCARLAYKEAHADAEP